MRAVRFMLVAAVAALVVAACGSAQTQSSSGSGPIATAATAGFPSGPVTIGIRWWGETEVPGAQKWLKHVEKAFMREHHNVTISDTLVSTNALVPGFDADCKAQSGPNLEYFWGGPSNSLEPAWQGCIVPVSKYLGMNEVKHYIAYQEDSWNGQVWTAGWYAQPQYPVVYDKATFRKVGVNPAKAFGSWAGLLDACTAFANKGRPMFGFGFKDLEANAFVRLFENIQTDQLNGMAQALAAVTGKSSFASSPWVNMYARAKQMIARRCFPSDSMSVDMYPAQQRILNGRAGAVVTTGTEVAGYAKSLGSQAGVALFPKAGNGKLAGKMGVTAQTFGITAWSSDAQKIVTASFIRFMHEPAQLASFYAATGAAPADNRFNVKIIKSQPVRQVYQWMLSKPRLNVENFIPYPGDDYTTPFIKMLTGQITTPKQAAQLLNQTASRWRAANRLQVVRYQQVYALANKQHY